MRLHSFALLARHNFLAMAIFWPIFQSAGSPNQWDQICWCVLFVRRNLPQKLILWSTSQATTPRLRIWRHQRCRPAWLFRWCAVNATIGLARDGIWKNTWTRRTQNLVLIVSWCSEIPLPTRYNATISIFQQHDDADQPGPLDICTHVHILWLLWGWKASPGAQKGRNFILTNKQTNKQQYNTWHFRNTYSPVLIARTFSRPATSWRNTWKTTTPPSVVNARTSSGYLIFREIIFKLVNQLARRRSLLLLHKKVNGATD